MGFVPLSARDPIFWLHHANVDRLWSAWIKGGKRNMPSEKSRWGITTWKFDEQGSWTQRAGAMLDSEKSLNYRYDDENMPVVVPAAAPQPVAKVIQGQVVSADLPQSTAPVAISSTPNSFTLSSEAVAVNLPISAKLSTELLKLLLSPGSSEIGSAMLLLHDVELGKDGKQGGFSYEIIATLPSDRDNRSPLTLGVLNSFTLSAASHEAPAGREHDAPAEKQTLAFDLLDILAAWGTTNPIDLSDGLRITFDPSHPPKSGLEQPEFVHIGALRITVTHRSP
jgi:tyrosinase